MSKNDNSAYLAYFLPPVIAQPEHPPTPSPSAEGALISVEYSGEGTRQARVGDTILQVSHAHHIPHMASCGGQAQCSTCRVEILKGLSACAPRNEAETAMARRKSFPPRIRLACQTRLHGSITLKRLIFDQQDAEEAVQQEVGALGQEIELAVLFCDVRAFTPFVENNPAYDVVHLLNRYFNVIGQPIHQHYGYIDKYIGDGIMVLFGLNPQRGIHPCVDAVNAALGMQRALDGLNAYCCEHFQHHFKIGIGIHYGPVIIGEVGFHLKRQFTALGDVVNTAARIESMTKGVPSGLLVSEVVKQHLPAGYDYGASLCVILKGKSGQYLLHEINGTTV